MSAPGVRRRVAAVERKARAARRQVTDAELAALSDAELEAIADGRAPVPRHLC